MAQPATLARLARHEPRREDASHDGFQLAPEPADAERRAQITTRVEDGPALLLGDAPAARERRATEPRSSRASGATRQKREQTFHNMETVETGLPSAGCVQTFEEHCTSINSLSVCAGGAQLITTGGDRTIRQFTSCIDHSNPAATGCSCTVS